VHRLFQKRVDAVQQILGTQPVPLDVERQAFGVFCETGELPDDDRVALAVVHRTIRGYELIPDDGTRWTREAMLRAAIRAPAPVHDDVRDALYFEALDDWPIVRSAARLVISTMVDLGVDPTRPMFAKRKVPEPDWNAYGLHFLGFTRLIGEPLYSRQAERLCRRFGELRLRVPQTRTWFARLATAVTRFRETGEVPDDELMLDALLADAELVCLLQNRRGIDVAEPMALFDELAAAEAAEREPEVARLQAFAAAGRLALSPADDRVGR
jgi:hypothetical protein